MGSFSSARLLELTPWFALYVRYLRKLFKVSLVALMLKTTLRLDARPRTANILFTSSVFRCPSRHGKITFEFLERDGEVEFLSSYACY